MINYSIEHDIDNKSIGDVKIEINYTISFKELMKSGKALQYDKIFDTFEVAIREASLMAANNNIRI